MSSDPPVPARRPRPPYATLLARALRLRCPRCGQGKLYTGWFTMPPRCGVCGLKFHRDPGYYLGAVYINYGLTSLIVTAAFIIGKFKLGFTEPQLLWPLFAFCIVFPAIIFRHARAVWLAMDCQIDKSVLEDEDWEYR